MQHNTQARTSVLVRLAIIATMVVAMLITAVHIAPVAHASGDPDTYSWPLVPCVWSGQTTGSGYWCSDYDWGVSTLPSGDTYTTKLNGYYIYDNWGYEFRNCTSYVAEKISQEFNGRNVSGWGDAANWKSAAQGAGYQLDSSPQVGDIAVWGTEVASGHGHVAYVAAINNGVATFDEYNAKEDGTYTNSYTSTSNPSGRLPDWYIHMGAPTGGGGYEEAFQANTGHLYTFDTTNGAVNAQLGMMSGTSPSIAALAGGGYEEAFQANTGHLWVAGSAGSYDTQLGMMSGTSPSIAASPSGGFRVAFQDTTGHLWIYDSASGGTATQEGMMSGTSPSIAALAGGGYEEAFQANTGNMYMFNGTSDVNSQMGMMSGTSPSIAASPSGGFRVAIQANTGEMWTFDSSSGGVDTHEGMMSGTSPSIAALAGGGYEEAFQANTGYLYTYNGASDVNTQQGMMSGTSPSIAASPSGGYQAAFQANTGYLFTFNSADGAANTQQGMMSGTSPSIAA